MFIAEPWIFFLELRILPLILSKGTESPAQPPLLVRAEGDISSPDDK
jgi:hypothetical protein